MRTFARMTASLQEEAEATGWYTQRISLETDTQAKAIIRTPCRRSTSTSASQDADLAQRLNRILFSKGDIVKAGEEAEEAAD